MRYFSTTHNPYRILCDTGTHVGRARTSGKVISYQAGFPSWGRGLAGGSVPPRGYLAFAACIRTPANASIRRSPLWVPRGLAIRFFTLPSFSIYPLFAIPYSLFTKFAEHAPLRYIPRQVSHVPSPSPQWKGTRK